MPKQTEQEITMTPAQMSREFSRINRARAGLALKHPFFAVLAYRLKMKPGKVQVMATNGRELLVNPVATKGRSRGELQTLLAHECMHLACGHHTRMGDRDPELWNIAGDFAINPILREAGFEMPKDALMHEELDGQTAEQIYDKLTKMFYKDERRQMAQAAANMGTVSPPPGQQPQEGQKGEKGEGESGKGKPEKGQSGEGESPNRTKDWENEVGQATGGGQSYSDWDDNWGGWGDWSQWADPKKDWKYTSDPAELTACEREWKEATAEAISVGGVGCGTEAANLIRRIKETLEPSTPWQDILRDYLSRRTRAEHSWLPPNRRYVHRGYYFPQERSETKAEFVIAVDTSGSIGEDELNQFAAEVTSILEDVEPTKVTVIYCDARVQKTQEFTPEDFPITLHPHGGGGTRFSPVFKYVKDYDLEPDALIYLTDMCCNDFGDQPPYPVIWARSVRGGRGYNQEPPFGTMIDVEITGK